MCYKLSGSEAKRLRVYLDEWATAHHKYKPLSAWVSGLSAWTKELQVYACLAMLEQSISAWTQHREPDETFKRYFEGEQPKPDVAELGRAWLKVERPRSQIEQELSRISINYGMGCDSFLYMIEEYNPGPDEVRRSRERGLSGIKAFLMFCEVLVWTPERESQRFGTTDIEERAARAAAGPVEESTRCIMYQILAMGIGQREGKRHLIEHLLAALR
jgi:hypothetical protein